MTCEVQLFSPVDFISRLDSIEREQEYQPSRLGASSIVTKRLEPQEITRFIESFRRHPHEKISAFKNLIDTCLLDPKTTSVQVAHDSNADINASGATVYLPKLQMFTPESLTNLAARLSRRDFPAYPAP